MATYLYRLGRFSFRRRRLVAVLWMVLFVGFAAGAATLAGPPADAFSIPGTEAQKAIDMLEQRFPEASANGATARVVFAAPEGEQLTDPANRTAVESVVAGLRSAPEVASVADPFEAGTVSPDSRVAFAQVTYGVAALDLTADDKDALLATAEPGRDAGLTVEYGGNAVAQQGEQGAAEVIGILVAAIVLIVTFGSLIAAGLPLLTAIVGIGIGICGVTIVSGFVDISSSTPTLALMLGLAVAIDYALFIVFRYRHEYAALEGDGEEAAGRAVGTAGSAVVFAGLTVVVALAGMSVVGIPILTQIGLAAAGTVAVAVVIALTLLPAMLGFAGRKVFRRKQRKLPAAELAAQGEQHPTGQRWARWVTRRPVPILLLAVVGLGVVAIPSHDLRLGLPDDSTAATGTTQRASYDIISEGFGPGFNGPLTVVVDAAGAADRQGAAQRVADTVRGLPDVVAVNPPVFNAAGDTALLSVVPGEGPNAPSTEKLVGAIRDEAAGLREATGAAVTVTGQTAVDIDVSHRIQDALVPYLAVIVGLAFILLMLVFRSILIPLTATIGFLLSVAAATFGAVVAVFQWGWLGGVFGVDETGPIISLLPIFLIGVVFGLAMDYQIFLVSRMREEYVHGATPVDAVVTGYSRGAQVVTAAAVIMISVFFGFMMAPESLVRQVGFALAVSVVFDAFVVRTTIVPAAMALMGRAAWWLPKWLDKILPNVDVEGEKLRRNLAAPQPAGETAPAPSEGQDQLANR
ncbi:MMPL family transporter [Micromonospora sp. CPCC 206061]|uniref:MMPL family transporter n=1 Tax=Micromonospora sp. CPCC 206061 TaxID=3122410 RepID=UPI002FEF8B47